MLDEQVAQGQMFQSDVRSILDRFKAVNDTHGHLIGKPVAGRDWAGLLKRCLGPNNAAVSVMAATSFVASATGDGQVGGERNDDGAARGPAVGGAFSGGRGTVAERIGSFGLATYPETGNTVPTILRAGGHDDV